MPAPTSAGKIDPDGDQDGARENFLYFRQADSMDVDDLRILTAVAKHGSMNRAAAELHMVQSAVTARIRSLEEELGVRLFVRHSRGVRLSDAGERLLPYSGRIHALLNEAISATREDGAPKGSLTIGSTEPTVSMRLPGIIANYARQYPAVSLSVTTGNSPELVDKVIAQELDGAFVAAPVSHSLLSYEPIFPEKLVLAAPSSLRSLEDLANTSGTKAIVLDQGCSYRDRLSEVLNARGIAHEVFSVASFDAIRSCVQAGIGVTLLPAEFFSDKWRELAITAHELPEFADPFETVFIRRVDSERLSALQAFLTTSRAWSNLQKTEIRELLSKNSIAAL
jgi:LysR family transcriptional regulator, cell division regulator